MSLNGCEQNLQSKELAQRCFPTEDEALIG